MKKRSLWSRIGNFLMGKGFYMVLLLCVMAIGGSGYYLYQLASDSMRAANQPVSGQAEVEVETSEGSSAPDDNVAQGLADALAEAEAEAASEMADPLPDSSSETEAEPDPAQEAAETVTEEAQETAETVTEEAQETAETVTEEAQETAEAVTEEAQETAETVTEEAQTTFAPPVSGETVAAFSDSELTYNAALEDWRTHNGVDLSAELGDPVAAVLDGEVLSVTEDVLLGTTVTLNHGNGLMTVYGNLAQEVQVEQGDVVTAGQTLGTVGNTAAGEQHEGAWLHFAVQQDGVAVDPADYLE